MVATGFSALNDSAEWRVDASSIRTIGRLPIRLDGDGPVSLVGATTSPSGSPGYPPQPCPLESSVVDLDGGRAPSDPQATRLPTTDDVQAQKRTTAHRTRSPIAT